MPYDFSVLRLLRKRKNMTVGDLSRKCRLSYVNLSKLERNIGNPELRTLDRISRALDISTHYLLALAERKRPSVVHDASAKTLGTGEHRYVNVSGVRIFYVHAPAGASGCGREYHDDDYEYCYLLEGRLKVTVREKDYTLEAGEAMMWDCQFDHNYEALEPVVFITILVPKRP